GTVVSSAWMRSAAKTWLRIASTSGVRVAAEAPNPVRERRDIEVDTFAPVNVALTMERQVQAVLGEQDMGQQLRSRASTRNRVRGCRWLGDRFAGPAD